MQEASKVKWAALVFVLVVGAGVAGFIYLLQGRPGPAGPPELSEAPGVSAPGTAAAGEPAGVEPVDAASPVTQAPRPSDDDLRALAAALSADPLLEAWLRADHLLDKFVAAVEAIARGESPRKLVPFLGPAGRFTTLERDGREFLDPEGYRRYDPLVAAFVSLDLEGVTRLMGRLDPWLQKAHRSLGLPGRTFRQALVEAFAQLLRVPSVRGDIPLVREVVLLKIDVPALEAMSDAQKHLFRMGPDNIAQVQARLRELARGLGIAAELQSVRPLDVPLPVP
jgi:hypothetical protein